MDSPYSVEEEIEIEKINLPKFSETVLKNKKLKKMKEIANIVYLKFILIMEYIMRGIVLN